MDIADGRSRVKRCRIGRTNNQTRQSEMLRFQFALRQILAGPARTQFSGSEPLRPSHQPLAGLDRPHARTQRDATARSNTRGICGISTATGMTIVTPNPVSHGCQSGSRTGSVPMIFGRIICVRFLPMEGRRADVDLAIIPRLNHLEALDLHGAYISNAALGHLEGMTHLRRLDLELSAVSDVELGGVSDVGIAHLKGLTNLQSLDPRCNRLSDAGMCIRDD